MAEPASTGTTGAITRERLIGALIAKSALNTGSFPTEQSYEKDVADAIRIHGLESVIAGRHLGKPVTFEAAFTEVFGQGLDGRVQRAPRKKATEPCTPEA